MDPGYKHRVSGAYPELARLFEVGEYVNDLSGHPGWAHIQGLLDAEIGDIDARLDGSKPLRLEEYAHLHGQRRGLLASRQLASTIQARHAAVLSEQQERHEASGESGAER